jgi:DNA-binding FrmR family transcriptional regulator
MGINNKSSMNDEQKTKTLIGFKKARSLLNKIIKMSEDGEYCINIMQQNLATIGLLRSAHQQLMENHLNTCFKNAMASNNEKKKKAMTEEILKVTNLFNK